MINAWASGGDMIQQTPQWVKQKPVIQHQPKPSFEQKAKDTIMFLGDNWGFGPLLIVLLAGGIFRKKLIPWITSPKKQLRKWISS